METENREEEINISPTEITNIPTVPDKDIGEATQIKYYKIYQKFIEEHLTHIQLATEFAVAPSTIKRAISWASKQVGDQDITVYSEEAVNKLAHQIQKLSKMLDDTDDINEKVRIFQEIRNHIALQGKLRGIGLSNKGNNLQQQINIVMPDIHRGEGVASVRTINQ